MDIGLRLPAMMLRQAMARFQYKRLHLWDSDGNRPNDLITQDEFDGRLTTDTTYLEVDAEFARRWFGPEYVRDVVGKSMS
jgi:hypothetical protein